MDVNAIFGFEEWERNVNIGLDVDTDIEDFPVESRKKIERLYDKMAKIYKEIKKKRDISKDQQAELQRLSDKIVKIKFDYFFSTPGEQNIGFFYNYYASFKKPGTRKIELKDENLELHVLFTMRSELGDDIEGDSYNFEYRPEFGIRRVEIYSPIPYSSRMKFIDPVILSKALDWILIFDEDIDNIDFDDEKSKEFFEEEFSYKRPYKYVYFSPKFLKENPNFDMALIFTVREPKTRVYFKIEENGKLTRIIRH